MYIYIYTNMLRTNAWWPLKSHAYLGKPAACFYDLSVDTRC